MRRLAMACLLVLALSGPALAYDGAGEARFQAGTAAFAAGDYQTAATEFTACLGEVGDEPTVHYNLALVYLRLEQKGKALAHLEAARRLAPRDADVHRQLRLVRAELDAIQPPPASWLHSLWAGLRRGLTYGETLWFATVANLIACGLGGGWLLTRRRRFAIFGAAAALVALLGCALWATRIAERIGPPVAIVTEASVPLRGGPGDEFGEIARLAEGSKVALLDRPRLTVGPRLELLAQPTTEGLWVEVRADSGARGYVRRGLIQTY